MLLKFFRVVLTLSTMLFLSVFLTACDKNDVAVDPFANEEVDNLFTRSPESGPDVCDWVETAFPAEALSPVEEEALLYMREEEKLARDVYRKMFEKWGVRPFRNIANAEQRHMDATGCLIDKYGLEDPVTLNAAGVFQNEELSNLYETLTAQGEESLVEAYQAGALIEITDILDLQEYAKAADNEDILAVFNELERGSRNHLRAFARNLENLDIEFDPAPMSEDAYLAIIKSDMEKGGVLCGNTGNGKGKGKGKGNCTGAGQGKKYGKGSKNKAAVGKQTGKGLKPCDGTGKDKTGGKGNKGGKGKGKGKGNHGNTGNGNNGGNGNGNGNNGGNGGNGGN